MKSQNFSVMRYDADEGMVFDWKEPQFNIEVDENGNKETVQVHLNAKTLFLGVNDNIDNYIEVKENK